MEDQLLAQHIMISNKCAQTYRCCSPKECTSGITLKLKWLKENMLTLPAKPTQQLATNCRAYILGLMGGILMLDKLGNKVHMMYLPLLANLE